MPIYSVNFQDKKRLVKASTIAGARNHVLKPLVPEIIMLDAEGVADAMGAGMKVEVAGEEVPSDPPKEEIKQGGGLLDESKLGQTGGPDPKPQADPKH